MTNSEGEHVRTALDGADRCHASASNWIAATPESRPAAAAEEPQQCWNKGCKAESSSLCVGCKKASYCSRKCQVRAWLSVASSICSWGCFQLTTALFTLLCFDVVIVVLTDQCKLLLCGRKHTGERGTRLPVPGSCDDVSFECTKSYKLTYDCGS